MEKTFAVSGQHYLFSVQAFAHTVLVAGGGAYSYAFRDRTTLGVMEDVVSGRSCLGVLFKTSATEAILESALQERGLEFVSLIASSPRIALSASHPLVNAKSLSLEDVADYPYVYFEQDEGVSAAFAEEAFAEVPRSRRIATTDRASLSELIAAINGYTITSGILVGISDGAGLSTVPLRSDVELELGYIIRQGGQLGDMAQSFVEALHRDLERYARL